MSLEKFGSVASHDRSCVSCAPEAVVHADAEDVAGVLGLATNIDSVVRAVAGLVAAAAHSAVCDKGVGRVAEVIMQVFGLERPVVRERPFYAAAERPAGPRLEPLPDQKASISLPAAPLPTLYTPRSLELFTAPKARPPVA